MFLLDAHNLLYRYYHAAPVQMHQGHNVNAVRGLRSLVTRLLSYGPGAVTIVFDGGGSCSGRKDLLPAYKAGRTDMPDDLRYQVELARDYMPRFGASTVRVDGYEADDLALPAREAGHRVYLLTSDKDMLSLVTDALPPIHVYTRIGDGWSIVKEAGVQERLGVPPGKVLDMLALCGDKVDGIPGVPGVGDKDGRRVDPAVRQPQDAVRPAADAQAAGPQGQVARAPGRHRPRAPSARARVGADRRDRPRDHLCASRDTLRRSTAAS
jgi:DNA polymerase-1